jgi:hypothetical protein
MFGIAMKHFATTRLPSARILDIARAVMSEDNVPAAYCLTDTLLQSSRDVIWRVHDVDRAVFVHQSPRPLQPPRAESMSQYFRVTQSK